jgi:hypothetical protein
MSKLRLTIALLTSFTICTTASARPSDNLARSGIGESGAHIGIVIPFGSNGSSAERAPRLEAWSGPGQHSSNVDVPLLADRDQAYGQPTRFGVTITGQPRMMHNGREVPGQVDRHNVSALGWIGITAGVAAIVVGAAVLGAFGNFSN